MRREVRCPGCHARYQIDVARMPAHGGHLTCPSCATRWLVSPESLASAEGGGGAPAARPGGPPAPHADPPRAVGRAAHTRAAPEPFTVECPRCGHGFEAPARQAAGRPSVLIVDDQEFFRNFAVDLLSDRYQTHVAKSADEAVAKAQKLRPDLLILDLGLEGGPDDGRHILSRLGGSIPVLIMTGRSEVDLYGETWRELEALGAREVVFKSLAIGDDLRSKVARLIGQ